MIVPMHKYTFLVYHSAYKSFLKDIRKIGVVHISTKNNEPTPEMQELFRHLTEVDKEAKKLEMLDPEETKTKPELATGEEVFNRLKVIEKELEHTHNQILQFEKDKKQLKPWGDFDWKKVKLLENKGVYIRFMTCAIRKYDPSWEDKYYLRVIGDLDGYRYFVKIEKAEGGVPENGFDEISGADELILPDRSLSEVNAEIDKQKSETDALNHELHQIAFFSKPLLQDYHNEIQEQLAEQNALLQTTEEVDGKVKLLEGWVPETKKAELDAFLEQNQILFTAEKPDETDKVPILLKNNRFARLYEVIGQLYELPNHKELDLVPFFAPFYMMFFGFSLGDAGYGLVIMAAAQWMKKKMPNLKSVMSLAQWLGLATVIFGILTGTFFGIDLINSDIPWLESVKSYMISTDELFNLAIIFGAIQIIFGMVLKVVNITRVHGFWYSLSTIGWLILLVGSGAVYGLKSGEVVSPQVAGIIQNVVFAVAGVLILVLNHPKRNVFINVGAGLWDVYSMATSLLGDILSYIRLFALGVSSAILGLVFNSMAMSMKPDNVIFGPIVMIIILIVGHGITIFMSSLGAFVHPIRLTFVEFYKNAGFTGGGKAYKPFAEPASKTNE
ncbi:V/A-type H+-transporting ATPase subunit I [Mariniphaga anaerophila]|uniref:V/A-type H+-transporting ATPase subunit I n=1 Tax=Mariniphaga anaerophila TaxID=1484053 RepID=A0A1M5DQZ8_9BACT|nr:V-type ATPase 116kDa subunit family protein [Mariniphaga anaerophila]SHF69407.1 V/A-type H+-transporting ATPase subunit I [Mariniphaga anaerophila]